MVGNFEGLMTLGELIDRLENVSDKDKGVITSGGTYAAGFSSYRGYYEELAIVPSIDNWQNVTEFLQHAKDAVGKTFTGWKGGEYLMDRDNPLWLAAPGHCPGIGLKKIIETDYNVILVGKKTSDA